MTTPTARYQPTLKKLSLQGCTFGLAAVMLSLIFPPNVNGVVTVALAICWLSFYITERPPVQSIGRTILIGVVSLYILLIIGLLNTENLKAGLKLLETKAGLLFFPIFFLTVGRYLTISTRVYLLLFAFATTLACLFCHGAAAREARLTDSFLSSFLSINYLALSMKMGFHPTYLGMFAILAQVIFVEQFKRSTRLHRYWLLIPVGYLFLFNLHLLARMAIIVQLMIAIFTILFYVRRRMLVGIVFAACAAIGIILISQTSEFKERISLPIHKMLTSTDFRKDYAYMGFQRYEMLYCAVNLLKSEAFFVGFGTGDVKSNQLRCYAANGFEESIRVEYNAHNEYLQTWLTNGILAVSIYIFILVSGFRTAALARSYSFFSFLLILTFFSFTESILSVQKGVVFFSIFISIFAAFSERPTNALVVGGRDHGTEY